MAVTDERLTRDWFRRASGVVLHPTSLPGAYGIGTLGTEAIDFIEFLAAAGQSLWQMCPLGPTGFGDSPYQSFSAFAGNPLLINIEDLVERGYLAAADGDEGDSGVRPAPESTDIDYGALITWKLPLLARAHQGFQDRASVAEREEFAAFDRSNRTWLEDYALFMALKDHHQGRPWYEWDLALKTRDEQALAACRVELQHQVECQKFLQFTFFRQWSAIREVAAQHQVRIIGDLPLYVAHDSADVWANPHLYQLDEARNPTLVAGVPPDYFSETGQLWGNPIYDWDAMARGGFRWWLDRIQANLTLYDIIRIDHFRGLAGYWSVPYGEETAVHGNWCPGPGRPFFEAIRDHLGSLPIIAEDLGVITPDVEELRDGFGLPGMKVLQFAFDSDEGADAPFLPHNFGRHCIVYTGTHDNDTVVGWYHTAPQEVRRHAAEYLNLDPNEPHWGFLRGAWASTANFALAPLQDLLGLGSSARLNRPAQGGGNWRWRYPQEALSPALGARMRKLTRLFGRSPKPR
jgi:4-alpha-glucanotransferase